MKEFVPVANVSFERCQISPICAGVEGDALLPELADLCASAQHTVVRHLVRRTQRALAFCTQEGLLGEKPPTVVVAGGVAANAHLSSVLAQLCSAVGASLVPTPNKLCGDNGLMVAWNGMERWRAASGVVMDYQSVDIEPR